MNTLLHYTKSRLSLPIIRQISWFGVGQIAVQLFSFLGVIITSRYLGPINVGLYSFVQNYLAAFMTITTGMDFYFTWKVAKSDDKLKELKEYFGHKVLVTLFLAGVGILIAWYILPKDVALMSTVMFVPLVLNSCTAFFLYAVTTNRARMIALTQFTTALLLFIAKVILVFLKATLILFVAVSAIDTVMVGIFITIFYFSQKQIRESFKGFLLPSLFSTTKFLYSIRMSMTAIVLWQLILRIDQLVLAMITNAYHLGIYAAAVKIAEVPNFLAGVLYTALVSHVALFAGKDDENSKISIKKVMKTYFFSGVLIAIVIILFAPLAVHILYGSRFLESIPVLRVYALSIPGMFMVLHYFAIYGAKERHSEQVFVFTCGLILNIVLVFLLTPIFGLMGTALATVITYNLASIIFYFRVK